MKLSDLKDRMLVELRNGKMLMVTDGLILRDEDYIYLESYNDDLTYKYGRNLDIVRVYDKIVILDSMKDKVNRLWERNPELKNGMVVRIRRGDNFLVIGNKLLGEASYINKSSYLDDLTCPNNNNYDIMSVYNEPSTLKGIDTPDLADCIWNRN